MNMIKNDMIKSRTVIHSFKYIEQTPPRTYTTHPETGERLVGLELSSPLSACLEMGPARDGDVSAVQALGLCHLLHEGCFVGLETSGLFLSPLFSCPW